MRYRTREVQLASIARRKSACLHLRDECFVDIGKACEAVLRERRACAHPQSGDDLRVIA